MLKKKKPDVDKIVQVGGPRKAVKREKKGKWRNKLNGRLVSNRIDRETLWQKEGIGQEEIQ